MISPIYLKRGVKKVTSWSSVLLNAFAGNKHEYGSCIFYYHRIADLRFTDSKLDDRNVPPSRFEEHLAALTEHADVVPLNKLLARMNEPQVPNSKPLVSLTFDDGYANFFMNVVPTLEKYGAHATLFVVTSEIAHCEPAAFDRWAHKNQKKVSRESWRMIDWKELDRCVASGFVTLGGHSHRHLKANNCSQQQIDEEAGFSAEILRTRFGAEHAKAFAYPYGNSMLGNVSDRYESAVRAAGFELAVTTDVGMAKSGTNPFRLPRLEAHNMDTAKSLRAKASGFISPLYCNEWFHELRYRTRNRFGGSQRLHSV